MFSLTPKKAGAKISSLFVDALIFSLSEFKCQVLWVYSISCLFSPPPHSHSYHINLQRKKLVGKKSLAFPVLLFHQQFSLFMWTSRFGFNLIQERHKVLTRGQNLKDLKCQSERNDFVINQVQASGVQAMTFFFFVNQILRHLHDLVAHHSFFIMALSQLACLALAWEKMNLFSQHHKVVLPSGQDRVRSSALIGAQWSLSQFFRHQRQGRRGGTVTNHQCRKLVGYRLPFIEI